MSGLDYSIAELVAQGIIPPDEEDWLVDPEIDEDADTGYPDPEEEEVAEEEESL